MKPTATYPLSTPRSDLGRYRYFFNGQESDAEVYGSGGLAGYEFRQYDTRLGRWWGIDRKAAKYPSLSPYQLCAGNPIIWVDPQGDTLYPSEAFQTTQYYGVYQRLLQSNNTYNRLLVNYQGYNNHFYLDYSDKFTKKAGSNHWKNTTTKGVSSVTSYTTYYRPSGRDQSEIAMAKTLLHEAVHAVDALSKIKRPYHDGFDQISVLSGLIEYNSTFKLGYSYEDLEILSWVGLQESLEYCNFIEHQALLHNRTCDEEDDYVKNRMIDLMYGTDLDE